MLALRVVTSGGDDGREEEELDEADDDMLWDERASEASEDEDADFGRRAGFWDGGEL